MTNSINPPLSPTAAGTKLDQRRYPRHLLSVEAEIRFPSNSHRWTKVQALEYSETGLSLDIPPHPDTIVGKECLIRIKGLKGIEHKKVLLNGLVKNKQNNQRIGIHFEDLVTEQVEEQLASTRKVFTAAVALALIWGIVFLKARNVISFWYGPLIQAYSIGAAFYVLSRIILACIYRAPKDRGYKPSVSLIIAVKNEEDHIAETIRHCFDSRYPKDRLEVIVIDDGSDDGTWEVLNKLKETYTNFRCFKFNENRGKRHAMALGSRVCNGDFLVFIDSDTFLKPEALYRLVQPFADERIGAVAGHTLVIIEENNLISKMEAVRYFVSQRVIKAGESVFNAVTCCPGPLSAYRKNAVLPILDDWENQMFLGAKATFGDDRSLTNYILRNYRVVYHAGAKCATYTPSKMSVFIKQQLRWKKSWLRELTVAGRFMWQKHPIAAISYYIAALITLVSPLIAFGALVGLPSIGVPFNMFGYLTGLLMVYALFGLIFHYFTRSDDWPYGMVFAILYVFVFSFQNYYALVTIRKNKWGTR